MEVVLTGRLVLLDQEATEASPNNKAEEEKKLAAASHEDTKPRGLGDDAKTATTPARQPKDAAGGAQEEAAAQDVAAGAEAATVVDEAANNKGGAKYRWEGKWYFRGNKNKSSTFSYEVLWSHQNEKPQQQPEQNPTTQQSQEDVNKESLLGSSEKKSDIKPNDKSTTTTASATVEMTEVLAASQPSPKSAAGACASNFSPLSLMAGTLEDDAIIDEQLHLSLLSDLPSNLLLGDDNIFDLDRAGAGPDFLDDVGLLGGGGEGGMHMSSALPTTAESVAAGAAAAAAAAAAGARLSDLFPFDACAKCHGGFLVHNPSGEGVNEIAETFELTILRPSTGVVANANSSSSYVEVLGEGRNVYGEFILEGKINAQHGLRMICHRRYKSDLAKRAAKATKAKSNSSNSNNNSNSNSSASLADASALDGSNNTTTTAPSAGEQRRASNRITLGVRKTPLYQDQDAGAAGFNLAMPVSATFAFSSAGKLLKAAQACNRAELRRAWWQWRQHVLADRQEEEERGGGAGMEKKASAGTGGGGGGGGSSKNHGSKRKFSSCSDPTSGGGMEDRADSGGYRQRQQQQQDNGADSERAAQQEEGPVAEGWVSALADEDGEVYEGEVVDGERDGVGICLFPNGLLYQGKWARGKEHGAGKLMTHSRCLIYDGEWSEGKMSGRGRYVFPSGGVYEGDWRENVRQGHGCYNFPGGASYEGDWREDLRWGFGVFTWADGSVYEGEWVRGLRQGKGTLRCAAFEYVGQWTDNKMEGKGVCAYENGQRYEGMWRGGLKDGRGRLVLSNGAAQYEGRFREDVLDGQGTLELLEPLTGAVEDEWVIPLDVKVDVARAHVKAGFGQGGT